MTDQDTTPDPMVRLRQDARVLLQARMLPMAELTEEQIDAIRKDYRSWRNKHGISDAAVAKQIDLSGSAISQFLAGTYAGDNEKIARSLNDWMELDARKRKSRLGVHYIPTRVAEEMRGLIDITVRSEAIGIIVSEPGTGKSLVLKVQAEKYHGIEIYGCEDFTPRTFMMMICKQLGLAHARVTTFDALESVIDKLSGTHRPIMVDEAHRLSDAVLSRLRTIHDRAGVPIVLAGTDEIIERIKGMGNGRGQFSSRCIQFKALDQYIDSDTDPGRQQDKEHLYTEEEVRKFLQGMSIKFDDQALMFLWALACKAGEGSWRLVKRVVGTARPYENDREKPLTARELVKVVQQMFGGSQGGYLVDKAKEYASKYKAA